MPRGGDFVSFFFTRGPEFCTEKLPRGGDFDGKIYWPGGGGGMVTGQIDTCITCHNQALATSGFCKGLCHAVAFLKRLN